MRKTIPRAKHVPSMNSGRALSNVEENAKGAKVSEKGIFLCDLGGLSAIIILGHIRPDCRSAEVSCPVPWL
jgi:hypothetical protein